LPQTGFSKTDAREFLRMTAEIKPPALLFSGGEPLCHPDFWDILYEARLVGIRTAVSTNGTLIGESEARALAKYSSYVGISLDGPRETHDSFRGRSGAFEAALRAVELTSSEGCRTGLRVTLARPILEHLAEFLELAEKLRVSRICFYHFMRSGRGVLDESLAPDGAEEDSALYRIIEWADNRAGADGRPSPEILTVGDAADSVRLYRYLASKYPFRARTAMKLLARSSGKPAGAGILSVRWDGAVFRNQFSWGAPLGNWRDIAATARRAGEKMKLARECESCGEMGTICGGRSLGFGVECRVNATSDIRPK
jgi:MoaA/NifB/PqqE/SkfB family radical SAM enzyme